MREEAQTRRSAVIKVIIKKAYVSGTVLFDRRFQQINVSRNGFYLIITGFVRFFSFSSRIKPTKIRSFEKAAAGSVPGAISFLFSPFTFSPVKAAMKNKSVRTLFRNRHLLLLLNVFSLCRLILTNKIVAGFIKRDFEPSVHRASPSAFFRVVRIIYFPFALRR